MTDENSQTVPETKNPLDDVRSQLREWVKNNPSQRKELYAHVSKRYISDMINGKSNLEGISAGKKMRLYDMTGIAFFKVDTIHPREMDIEKIIAGEQDRTVLRTRIEYDSKNLLSISKLIGVPEESFRKFIKSEDISDKTSQKIKTGLRRVYSAIRGELPDFIGDENAKKLLRLPPAGSTKRRDYLERKLGELTSTVDGLRAEILGYVTSESALTRLAIKNNRTTDERVNEVNTALDVLAENMEYFREASQKERETMIKNLDVNLWGYVSSIVGKLDRPSGADTIIRIYGRPNNPRGDKDGN